MLLMTISGVRWCGNRRASHFLHLTYGLIYSIAGGNMDTDIIIQEFSCMIVTRCWCYHAVCTLL